MEDLASPKDELKKKIVTLADTIRKWNAETVKARKSVRTQLKEIADLGLNKYKMQKTDLRDLVVEIFRYHGISESWIRKLLPEGLKYTSKTRISYLQRQEIEKERQRLLQKQASQSSQQESDQGSTQILLDSQDRLETGEYITADTVSKTHQLQELEESASDDDTRNDSKTTQNKLFEANQNIERLREDVRRLSERFDATAYLQTAEQDIPLIAQVDPVKKAIISIRLEDSRI
jgi:hypothetical protein